MFFAVGTEGLNDHTECWSLILIGKYLAERTLAAVLQNYETAKVFVCLTMPSAVQSCLGAFWKNFLCFGLSAKTSCLSVPILRLAVLVPWRNVL